MKVYTRYLIIAIPAIFLFFSTSSCNSKKKKRTEEEIIEHIGPIRGGDRESAIEWLAHLRNKNVDTIIFHKRICIGCCEFYNIFWNIKEKTYLKKFYRYIEEEKVSDRIIYLKESRIIDIVNTNYSELKKGIILPNQYKDEYNNIIEAQDLDHYCYTKIEIFTPKDSIHQEIRDINLSKYYYYEDDKPENINYLSNFNSKWNLLLTTIEQELINTGKTEKFELRNLRSKKEEIIQ